MKIDRVLEMPSIWTFQLKNIKEVINKYLTENWADPFAGRTSPVPVILSLPSSLAAGHLPKNSASKPAASTQVGR